MAPFPCRIPGGEGVRFLHAVRSPPPGNRRRSGGGHRRGEPRTPGTVAMAALPCCPPPGEDPGRRCHGDRSRHGLCRTRPDLADGALQGDPPGPRGGDRPERHPPRSIGHRSRAGGDPWSRPLRPRLPVRLRLGAWTVVRPAPVACGSPHERRDRIHRGSVRRPRRRVQHACSIQGGRLLRFFQRHPRP